MNSGPSLCKYIYDWLGLIIKAYLGRPQSLNPPPLLRTQCTRQMAEADLMENKCYPNVGQLLIT